MSGKASSAYLPAGLPIPVTEPDGLSAPYWAGLRENRLSARNRQRRDNDSNCSPRFHSFLLKRKLPLRPPALYPAL